MLDKLDGQPEADPEWPLFKEMQSMTPEELEALDAGPSVEDDERFEAAVERRAELRMIEATAELRQDAHRLRTALAEAEARLAPAPSEPLREVADLNERRQAASTAPSAPQTPPEKIVVPDGVEVGVGWKMPRSSRRNSGLS